MKEVFRELGRYRRKLFLLILLVLGTTVCTMSWPILMSILVDQAIPNKDMGHVFSLCGLMLLLVGIGIFCGVSTSRFAADISMGVGRGLRSRVFEKVMYFSRGEIDTFSTSSLITRTNSDISQIQTFLNQSLSMAISAPLMCIVGVVLSITQSPSLSVVLILAIPVMAVVMLVIGKLVMPLTVKIQNKIDEINLVTREKLTGARVIRAFGTTEFENGRFEAVNGEYRRLNKKNQRSVNLVTPVLTVILALTAAGILYLASVNYVYDGIDYTTGEVMAIVEYVMQIMIAVLMLTLVFILLPRAATSAKRVREVLDSKSDILSPEKPVTKTSVRGTLEFRDVSFTYKGSEVPALKHLSFKAGPGEVTAIIGGTGMGKTTIVNLIPRLYDATEGQVLVDGVDVKDYELKDLRSRIGFTPQKALLFSGTIDSNVAFGGRNASETDVEEAVDIAQSTDFVMKKEGQFEAHVAQGGSNFSGGQKQRLAIARAIVSKPEIYVFDDSFSALDFKTDKALRAALKKQTGNATTVIVAQRISTIMEADRIIVIDKGDIVGIGKHSELLKACSVYREIAQSQLGKEAVQA